MRHALKPFPSGENETDIERRLRIDVGLQRRDSGLDFHFHLTGYLPADLKRIVRSPLVAESHRQRKDELWKTTCFELFFGPADGRTYFEMNLSPSGDWNLYAFDDYRHGMRPVEGVGSPLVCCEHSLSGDQFVWSGRLEARDELFTDAFSRPSLVLGATAVVEYVDGKREYWALTHVGPKPDFHLRESFRIIL